MDSDLNSPPPSDGAGANGPNENLPTASAAGVAEQPGTSVPTSASSNVVTAMDTTQEAAAPAVDRPTSATTAPTVTAEPAASTAPAAPAPAAPAPAAPAPAADSPASPSGGGSTELHLPASATHEGSWKNRREFVEAIDPEDPMAFYQKFAPPVAAPPVAQPPPRRAAQTKKRYDEEVIHEDVHTKKRSRTPLGGSKSVYTGMKKVVDFLWKEDKYEYFRYPVDTSIFFDYLQKVQHPICLRDIRERVAAKEYEDLDEFEEEVNRIFDNCYKYNWETAPVYQTAVELQKKAQTKLRSLRKAQAGPKSKRAANASSSAAYGAPPMAPVAPMHAMPPAAPMMAPAYGGVDAMPTQVTQSIQQLAQSIAKMQEQMQLLTQTRTDTSHMATQQQVMLMNQLINSNPALAPPGAARAPRTTGSKKSASKKGRPATKKAPPKPRPTPAPAAPPQPAGPKEMTFHEKEKLVNQINDLPEDKIPGLVQIVRDRMPNFGDGTDDEVDEFDVDKMDTGTLRALETFVNRVFLNIRKEKEAAKAAAASSAAAPVAAAAAPPSLPTMAPGAAPLVPAADSSDTSSESDGQHKVQLANADSWANLSTLDTSSQQSSAAVPSSAAPGTAAAGAGTGAWSSFQSLDSDAKAREAAKAERESLLASVRDQKEAAAREEAARAREAAAAEAAAAAEREDAERKARLAAIMEQREAARQERERNLSAVATGDVLGDALKVSEFQQGMR